MQLQLLPHLESYRERKEVSGQIDSAGSWISWPLGLSSFKPELVHLQTKSRYALRFPNWGKPKRSMSSPHSTLVTKNSAMETRRPGTDSRRVGTRRARKKNAGHGTAQR
ncbi:hypothetical protein PAHAL_1G380600 [Panicum hallii]|uniref:Uncharacterized protein n=1 Tax=Panicum hallii TaxID=206008 RepID=A0A2T8KXK2_9POAL|nr:hypothetical protein PAHAL_1G380600 [Panicum hallii]